MSAQHFKYSYFVGFILNIHDFIDLELFLISGGFVIKSYQRFKNRGHCHGSEGMCHLCLM